MPTPDYNKAILIASEQERIAQGLPIVKSGNALSYYVRYWAYDSPTQESISLLPNYYIEEDGYILCTCITNRVWNSYSETHTFNIFLENGLNHYNIIFSFISAIDSNGIGATTNSNCIPVTKGDKIYYGVSWPNNYIPNSYSIYFIPVKKS